MEKPKMPKRATQKAKKPVKKKMKLDTYQAKLAAWQEVEDSHNLQYVLDMAQYHVNLDLYNDQVATINALKGKKRLTPAEAEKIAKDLIADNGKLKTNAASLASNALVKREPNPKAKKK